MNLLTLITAFVLLTPWICVGAHYTNDTAVELQSSLTNSAIAPGDTIWIRDGAYFPPYRWPMDGTNVSEDGVMTTDGVHVWKCTLVGETNNLITIRSYPGEWAELDRVWKLEGTSFLRFRDLEVYDSAKNFNPLNPNYETNYIRSWGQFGGDIDPSGHEWINLVIHDTAMLWDGTGAGRVIRGCILWYIGAVYLDHVTYPTGEFYTGNINAFDMRVPLNGAVHPTLCASNILFANGDISGESGADFHLATAPSLVFSFNYIYKHAGPAEAQKSSVVLGGTTYAAVSNNVIVTPGRAIYVMPDLGAVNIVNNTLHMSSPFLSYAAIQFVSPFPTTLALNGNHYTAQPNRNVVLEKGATSYNFADWQELGHDLTGSTATNSAMPPDSVHVIPNQDEPKRAHIAVFNFSSNNTVTVSLAGVLSSGDSYDLYSAQNYGDGAIQTGTYNGTSITVPMTNLTVAPFLYSEGLGLITPPTTSPEFAAFVVQGAAGGGTIITAVTVNAGTVNVGP